MLGFLGKQYPITLCYATFELSMAIFLLVGFMQSIPPSLIESAKIDGANSFDILMRVVMPISRNGIVTVIILAFVSIWNEYAYAMVMISNIKFRTLTILLASAKNEFFVEYGMMSAGVVVAVIPMIIVYSFLQDKIISGMVAGAVKG
jgi:raffinose/stachyose/melibiose transport system permease protein